MRPLETSDIYTPTRRYKATAIATKKRYLHVDTSADYTKAWASGEVAGEYKYKVTT